MKPRVRAQLHSSSARSSKIIKDHTQIKTVVEVEGVGRLVLEVDSRGGYSLRAQGAQIDAAAREAPARHRRLEAVPEGTSVAKKPLGLVWVISPSYSITT